MKNVINKTGVQFGVLLSIYFAIFNIGIFYFDKTMFVHTAVGFFNIAVIILIGIAVIAFAKKRVGGYITFKDAFTPYLIMVSIGLTVNYALYNILFNLVDPSAQLELNNALLAMLQETLKGSPFTPEQIAEQIDKAKHLEAFAPKSQLFLWAGSILRYSILGLLIAAIFKNKSEFTQPQPAPEDTIKQ